MGLVGDVILIDGVDSDFFSAPSERHSGTLAVLITEACSHTDGSLPTRQESNKVGLELSRVVSDVLASILSDHEHLSQVSLGLCVTLEPILIPTLLLTHLQHRLQPSVLCVPQKERRQSSSLDSRSVVSVAHETFVGWR